MDYKLTSEQFIENAKRYLVYKYAYAATGEVLTVELIMKWTKQYPMVYTDSYLTRTMRNLGSPVVDCSGLCYLAAKKMVNRYNSTGLYELAKKSGGIMKVSDAPTGGILYKNGHVGIKISQVQHIESRGVDYGVVIKDITSQPWECALIMPYIDYSAVASELVKEQPKIYTVQKGETLVKIAKQYSTTVDKLVKLNNIMNSDLIYTGQIIKLP